MAVSLKRVFAFPCCRAFLMFHPGENSSITANNDKHHQHQRYAISPSTSVGDIIFSKLLVKIPFNWLREKGFQPILWAHLTLQILTRSGINSIKTEMRE